MSLQDNPTRTEDAVRVGQVWADNDPRSEGRTIRVVEVGPVRAVCEILTNSDANRSSATTIRQRSASEGSLALQGREEERRADSRCPA